MELLTNIFNKDQDFKSISGYIGGGQTGKWTVEEAKEQNLNAPLIEKSLEIRKQSPQNINNYSNKLVALLRNAFGGHEIKKIKN